MSWAMALVRPFGRSTSPTERCVLLAVLSSASKRLDSASIRQVSSDSGNSLYSQSGSAKIEKKKIVTNLPPDRKRTEISVGLDWKVYLKRAKRNSVLLGTAFSRSIRVTAGSIRALLKPAKITACHEIIFFQPSTVSKDEWMDLTER